jgi:uncharacterized protein YwgA
MKKEDCFNEEINPDGISIILKNLDKFVWNRGYYFPTDEGIWYEIYVNDEIKRFYPDINLSNDDMISYINDNKVPNKLYFYDTNHRFETINELLKNIKHELIP